MKLTGTGILLRFLFALLLVLLSYNPSGYSYFHWVSEIPAISPYIVLSGLLLLIGWGLYLKSTFNAMGIVGVLASAAVLGCLLWMLIYWGWLSANDASAMAWVIEVLVAALLALGMCWSHFTRRLSGQVDIEDSDN
jgi:O-antigen/teichoic acid export membrane protein